MSIENNFERIATALEQLVKFIESSPIAAGNPPKAPKATKGESAKSEPTGVNGGVSAAPTPPVAQTVVTPPAPPVQTPTPPLAAPSPSMFDTPAMTAVELNDALVAEFNRLGGNRDPIVNEMAKMGVTSVQQLDPSKYQELLNNVKAIAA